MPKRKCVICGKYIENNEDSVPYKNRYAHTNCFNIAIKVATTNKSEKAKSKAPPVSKPKAQKELKEGLSEEEYQEKKKLCDYIREQTKKELTIKIYKLIEDYKKKYKLSYEDMYRTLYWYFTTQGHPVEGDMIGIIPYAYDEAKTSIEKMQELQKDCQNKMAHMQELYPDKTISSPIIGDRKIDQIDISKIGE